LNCIRKYYRVERSQIAFMKFIFEAYDGIAVLSTIDPQAGTVVLNIPPGCEADVETVMADLQKQMIIEPA